MAAAKAPRLDQINSAGLIRQARRVYGLHLDRAGLAGGRPAGVILHRGGGRVVFSQPTLLPEEVFVPADWLLGSPCGPAPRTTRQRLSPPWTTPQP